MPEYYDAGTDGTVIEEWTRALPHYGTVRRRRRQYHLEDEAAVRICFEYAIERRDGTNVREHARADFALYEREEIEELLARAKLRASSVYADYAGAPWFPGAARLVFVCERPQKTADACVSEFS